MFILFSNTSVTMKLNQLFLGVLIEMLFASCLLLKLEIIYAIVCPRCLEHINIWSRLNGLHEKLDKTADVTWNFFLNLSSDNLFSQPAVRSWSDLSVLEMFNTFLVCFLLLQNLIMDSVTLYPQFFFQEANTRQKNCSL